MIGLLFLLFYFGTIFKAAQVKALADTGDTLGSVLAEVSRFKLKLETLEQRLDSLQDAQILFYQDRSDCPIGYQPMQHADGRVIVIGEERRGVMSTHTLDDRKLISMPCASMIGVAENGFHQVCNIRSENSTKVSLQVKDLIPHVYLLACSRIEPSRPIVP